MDKPNLAQIEQAGSLVMAARLAYRRGDKDETRAKLKQAFALHPTDAGAIELLGDLYLEDGEQEKAIKLFERGLEFHPGHKGFEEKLALAHLDLAEMQRTQAELAAQESGEATLGSDAGTEKKKQQQKQRALALTFLVPGAGHFLNEENERGAWFLGAWFVTMVGSLLPVAIGYNVINAAQSAQAAAGHKTNTVIGWTAAVGHLHPIWQACFWIMNIALTIVYIAAMVDVGKAQERADALRKWLQQ